MKGMMTSAGGSGEGVLLSRLLFRDARVGFIPLLERGSFDASGTVPLWRVCRLLKHKRGGSNCGGETVAKEADPHAFYCKIFG